MELEQRPVSRQAKAAESEPERQLEHTEGHDVARSTVSGSTSPPLDDGVPGNPADWPAAPIRLGNRSTSSERDAETFAEAFVAKRSRRVDQRVRRRVQSVGRKLDPTEAASLTSAITTDPGQPLSIGLKSELERSLHTDLSNLRIHSNVHGSDVLRRLSSRALTFGDHVVVRDPTLKTDRQLIAHEAAHVAQQQGGDPVVQREGEEAPGSAAYPPRATVRYPNFDQVLLLPQQPFQVLANEHTLPFHFTAIFMRELLGSRYEQSYVEDYLAHRRRLEAENQTAANGRLRGEYPVRATLLDVTTDGDSTQVEGVVWERPTAISRAIAMGIIFFLLDKLDPSAQQRPWETLNITQENVETLDVGDFASRIASSLLDDENNYFPGWYTKDVMVSHLQSMAGTLRELRNDWLASEPERRDRVYRDLSGTIYQRVIASIDVVGELSITEALYGDREYRRFWRLPAVAEGATPTGPGESARPTNRDLISLLRYIGTQQAFVQAIANGRLEVGGVDGDIRVELWNRYQRFLGRTTGPTDPANASDLALRDQSDRTDNPFPSKIAHVPPLDPALQYEASQDSVHRFGMHVTFGDFYDHLAAAFGGFQYSFEVLRIPSNDTDPDSLDAEVESRPVGSGRTPLPLDVLGHELGREWSNINADYDRLFNPEAHEEAVRAAIQRQLTGLVERVGTPGLGPRTVFGAAAVLRLAGRVVSRLISEMTRDPWETDVSFGDSREPGLYVVRGIGEPQLNDDSEVRRATSVAWAPIWIRAPRQLADRGVQRHLDTKASLLAALEFLDQEALLTSDPAELELLRAQRDVILAAMSNTADERLRAQVDRDKALVVPESSEDQVGLSSYEREVVQDRLKRNEGILRRRAERMEGVAGELLFTTFITDEGTTISPLIEISLVSSSEDAVAYQAYELTTGRDANGRGSSRHSNPVLRRRAAIQQALRRLFESNKAFGRGQLGVFVPDSPGSSQGSTVNLRIEADATAIAMETVEIVTSALAVAALVAAPLTGGASLAFMMPIGIAGGIPATYRLIDGYFAGTLDFDRLETWLDVVDVLGALAGPLGTALSRGSSGTRTGLRLVSRSGRGLVLIGAGADQLGLILVNAHTMNEIQKIQNSPGTESEKRAKIVQLLAGAMQANGMAAGGRLLGSYADTNQSRAAARPDGIQPATGPGAEVVRPRDGADPATTRRPNQEPVGPEAVRPRPRTRPAQRQVDPATTRRPNRQEADADIDATAIEGPSRRLVPADDIARALPRSLREDIAVRRDLNDDSDSVRVEYRLGRYGLVTEIAVVAGRHATAADIRNHRVAIAFLQRYQGFGGRVRLSIDRMLNVVGLIGDPLPGTLAFEARGELLKLPGVIKTRVDELNNAIARGDTDAAREIGAKLETLQDQLSFYEWAFHNGRTQSGRGYVAALDAAAFARSRSRIVRDAVSTRNVAPPQQIQDRSPSQDRRPAFQQALRGILDSLNTLTSGPLTGPELMAVRSFLLSDSGRPLSQSEMARRLQTLGHIAQVLHLRPNDQTSQGASRGKQTLSQDFEAIAAAYRSGETLEADPRRQARSQDFDTRLNDVGQRIDALDPTSSPLEFWLAHAQARQDLANIHSDTRAHGEGRFQVTAEGAGSHQVNRRGVLGMLDAEAVEITARGPIDEPLDRSRPSVGLEPYVLRPSEIGPVGASRGSIAGRVQRLLAGYHRAHLVGPGFGSELFRGIWLAPRRFNLESQNRGIELVLRAARQAGWNLDVEISAKGDRYQLSTVDGADGFTVLREITYEVHYTRADASESSSPQGPHRVTFEIGPPPNGEIRLVHSDLVGLTESGLSVENQTTLGAGPRR